MNSGGRGKEKENFQYLVGKITHRVGSNCQIQVEWKFYNLLMVLGVEHLPIFSLTSRHEYLTQTCRDGCISSSRNHGWVSPTICSSFSTLWWKLWKKSNFKNEFKVLWHNIWKNDVKVGERVNKCEDENVKHPFLLLAVCVYICTHQLHSLYNLQHREYWTKLTLFITPLELALASYRSNGIANINLNFKFK